MLEIKIKPERDNFKMPVKGSKDAACYDVFASDIVVDDINMKATIYLGFSTEFQPEFKAVLIPRSSITKTNWVMLNSPGIIDPDYRGEWMIKLSCLHLYDEDKFPFEVGERVGQFYMEEIIELDLKLAEKTSETERGTGGFGSTNK